MLSFALKVVWFCLSLSGLLVLWVVLGTLSKRSSWARLLYGIGCTLLHGIFCIGLVWHMDPFRMPRAFCIAQTLLIGFSSLFLTGICTTLSFASSLIYWKGIGNEVHTRTFLSWRTIYAIPVFVFPLAGTTAQAITIFTLDAVNPFDGLDCDARNPSWVRFLGYAGLPLLFAFPVFCFSIGTIIHAIKRRTSRSPDVNVNPDPFTTLRPRRTHYKDFRKYATTPPLPRVLQSPSPSTQLQYAISPGRAPISPTLSSPVLTARQFHLPFSPFFNQEAQAQSNHQSQSHSPSSFQGTDSRPVSSLFPTFAPASLSESPNSTHHGPADFMSHLHYRDDWKEPSGNHSPPRERGPSRTPSSIRWNHEIEIEDDELGETVEFEEHKEKYMFTRDRPQQLTPDDLDMSYMGAPRSIPSPFVNDRSLQGHSPSLLNDTVPNVLILIISQLSFFITLLLACITPLIDAITHRNPPSRFGTQHVALLFSVWIPVIIIGCSKLWQT